MPSWKKVIVSGSDATLNSLLVSTAFTASGLNYPSSDGTVGQVVTTDGAGNLSFSNVENTTITIKNVSGATIAKGTPCYITGSGTSGNIAGVWPADASNPARMPAGVIAGETLSAGAEGIGLINGFIANVNTSAFNAGNTIYVAVGGGYTNVKPTGSSVLIQKLGNVEKSHASNGSGVINGPNYYNEVPNIQQGYTWVGNSNGVAIPYATSSIQNVVSSSYALTASYGTNIFTIGSSKIFSEYTSGGTNDALKLRASSTGAVFGVQNTNASGFSGIEYIDNAGSVKVFTGYNNAGTGEFRFNNIASNGYITFKIGSADKLTIANSGNVGIGAASPSYKLDVAAAGISDGIRLSNGGVDRFILDGSGVLTWGSSSNAGILSWGTSEAYVYGNLGKSLSLGAGGSVDMLYISASTGNVGIGTVIPSTKLHLNGTNTILTITDTTYNRTSQIGYVDSANLYLANDSNSNTYIGAYNNVFLGYGGGNVGIGNTSPTSKLDVSGTISGSTVYSSQHIVAAENLKSLFSSGDEGGEIFLNKSVTNTTLVGGVSIDVYQNKLRIWEIGGTNRGGYFDLSTLGTSVSTNLAAGGGGSGTVNGGTAGYVAYYPSSGTTVDDSGIYWDSGNSRMAVGNTSPSYKVDVSGDIRATGAIYANANGAMYFQGGDDAALYDINLSNHMGIYGVQDSTIASIKLGSGGGIISGKSSNIGIGTTNPAQKLDVNGTIQTNSYLFLTTPNSSIGAGTTNSAWLEANTGTAFNVRVNGADRLIVSSSGNVGIGNTNPLTKLHVAIDDNTFAGNTLLENTNTGTSALSTISFKTANNASQFTVGQVNNGGSAILYNGANTDMNFSTNASTRMTIAAGGNVGIGTTSPQGKLSVDGGDFRFNYGNTAAAYYFWLNHNSGQDGGMLWTRDNSTYDWQINNLGANGNLSFYSYGSGAPAVTFQRSNGYVGIGATSPSYPLEVNGAIVSKGGGFGGLDGTFGFGGTQTSITGNAILAYVAINTGGSGEKMRITDSGNVGIGTTSPNTTLDVNGNTLITGSLRVTAGITGSLQGNADTVTWTDSATSTFSIAMSDGTTAYYEGAGDLRWDGAAKVISVSDGAETLSLNGKYIEQTGTKLLNYYADRHVFGDNSYNYQGQLIGGSFDAAQDITCGGTKYFDIPHQSKPGWGLKHGAIEGPESAVYFRGKLNDSNVIEFPAYWEWLVHSESITVSLTPIGSFQPLYVAKIENNQAVIASNDQPINCHFVVYGERKDVERWDVEYAGYSRGQIADTE